MGGWLGGVEKLRIKLSQLSTKLKLKLKLSLAKLFLAFFDNLSVDVLINFVLIKTKECMWIITKLS